MSDAVESVRQVLQDFLAPELRQHRAELVSLRSETGLVRRELTSKIEAAESRLDSKDRRGQGRSPCHAGRDALWFQCPGCCSKMQYFMVSSPPPREIADLRIRVERLEKERGQLPQ